MGIFGYNSESSVPSYLSLLWTEGYMLRVFYLKKNQTQNKRWLLKANDSNISLFLHETDAFYQLYSIHIPSYHKCMFNARGKHVFALQIERIILCTLVFD